MSDTGSIDGGAHWWTLCEAAAAIRSGDFSSRDLVEHLLARIEKHNPALHAYVQPLPDQALEAAAQADREREAGIIRGPLHGVPVAVKDLCAMDGSITRVGSPYRDFKPSKPATVVTRLQNAGAVILGKLQLTEGAFASHHPEIVPPVSPWHKDYWTGVSSSGSGVATAAGLCFGSLGTDTGGSIRFPSQSCGVTGLKPTWGRVSRFGVFPLADTLDHIGPMTRSVEDAAAMLGVLAGADPDDPTAVGDRVPNYLGSLERGVHGLRVGFDAALCGDGVAEPVARALHDARDCLRDAGAEIREIEVPSGQRMAERWGLLCAVEAAVAHEATYPERASEYGPGLSALLDAGRAADASDLTKAQIERREFAGRHSQLFHEVDLYLSPSGYTETPTVADVAAMLGGGDVTSTVAFTAPTDASGSPALCLPSGFSQAGVPFGLQMIGRHLGEDLLLRAGAVYQATTDWHRRRPEGL